MADKKISALTSASTPLAGTEVLPIVQSATTKKVAVSDLTAGRQVAMAGCNSTDNLLVSAGKGVALASNSSIYITPEDNIQGARIAAGGSFKLLVNAGSEAINVDATTRNITWTAGNLIQGTAAKGVNFTTNTPAAGMTSQLLNWYEEGTWTPTVGANLTVVGSFSSSARYTRIGRQVSVIGTLAGSTSVSVVAGGVMCGGLPFTVSGFGLGNLAVSGAGVVGGTLVSATSVLSQTAIGPVSEIYFSATYFV